MVFNVTKLDKVLLLKTLYDHAAPQGLGRAEYFVRAERGENVVGLTDEECNLILSADHPDLTVSLMDYYKGKPIKLSFDYQRNGEILVDTNGYDSRNGRYRFLQALLGIFDLEEIVIVKKGYPAYLNEMIDEHTVVAAEELALMKNMLRQTIKHTDNGTYWKIDSSVIDYRPPFMREL